MWHILTSLVGFAAYQPMDELALAGICLESSCLCRRRLGEKAAAS